MRKDTKVNFDCSKYWKMEYLYLPAGGGGGWKVFGSQRRRLENLEKFPLIGGGGWGFSEKISGGGSGLAARLTPLVTKETFFWSEIFRAFELQVDLSVSKMSGLNTVIRLTGIYHAIGWNPSKMTIALKGRPSITDTLRLVLVYMSPIYCQKNELKSS